MPKTFFAFCIAVCILFAGACFAATPAVEILDYGLYKAQLDENARNAAQIELLKKTWRIPADPGALFGIRFVVGPASSDTQTPDVALSVRINHPQVEDLATGQKLSNYDVARTLIPGAPVVQLQRIEKDGPPSLGRWIFQVRQGEQVLAEREFEVYPPELRPDAASPGPRSSQTPGHAEAPASNPNFLAKDHARCRTLAPAVLDKDFTARTLVAEQTFGLHIPLFGDCCFLTLTDAAGDSYALVSARGQTLARFEAPSAKAKTRAVGFDDFNNDGIPEIVLLSEQTGVAGAGLPNRIYWSVVYSQSVYWTPIEAVDKDIARIRRYAELVERVRGARK